MCQVGGRGGACQVGGRGGPCQVGGRGGPCQVGGRGGACVRLEGGAGHMSGWREGRGRACNRWERKSPSKPVYRIWQLMLTKDCDSSPPRPPPALIPAQTSVQTDLHVLQLARHHPGPCTLSGSLSLHPIGYLGDSSLVCLCVSYVIAISVFPPHPFPQLLFPSPPLTVCPQASFPRGPEFAARAVR